MLLVGVIVVGDWQEVGHTERQAGYSRAWRSTVSYTSVGGWASERENERTND